MLLHKQYLGKRIYNKNHPHGINICDKTCMHACREMCLEEAHDAERDICRLQSSFLSTLLILLSLIVMRPQQLARGPIGRPRHKLPIKRRLGQSSFKICLYLVTLHHGCFPHILPRRWRELRTDATVEMVAVLLVLRRTRGVEWLQVGWIHWQPHCKDWLWRHTGVWWCM